MIAVYEMLHKAGFIDGISIPSVRKNAPDVKIPNNNSFEFGRMLELQYHLLEHVFHFLETEDLHSASLVNPTWDKAAKWELRKRTSATWITCLYYPKLCHIKTSHDLMYSNTAICIVAYSPGTIKLDRYLHLLGDLERITFAEYIEREVVPHKEDYCTISCTQVSGSNLEDKPAAVVYRSICIPVIPKIRTTMFYCNPTKKDQLSNFINDNERVRCVLVFTQRYRVNVAEFFLRTLLKGQDPKKVAMGGGLIKSTKTFQQKNLQRLVKPEDLFCITFLQEEGVETDFNAYSTVIVSNEESVHDYKPFEKELLKLKETSVLRRHGVIFRFCCFAKSFKEGETQVIEKHFPNYPILGMEVDGEIGWNSLNVQKDASGDAPATSKLKKFKAEVPQSLHGWSTVLVLATWGRKLYL